MAAIIGVIGGALSVAVSGSKNKSQDTRRKTDLAQLQVAFRTYRDENSTSTLPSYPTGDLIGDGAGVDTVLAPYLSGTIRDPLNSGSNRYYYDSSYNCNSVNRSVVLAETMGSGGNYTSVCGATAENLGNGVTPTASTYIVILK